MFNEQAIFKIFTIIVISVCMLMSAVYVFMGLQMNMQCSPKVEVREREQADLQDHRIQTPSHTEVAEAHSSCLDDYVGHVCSELHLTV